MKKIKFIYFDIGGVLIHWRGIFGPLSKATGKTVSEAERIYMQYDSVACRGVITAEEMGKKLEKDFKVRNGQTIDVKQLAIDNFKPLKETHGFITTLMKQYHVGLLTNVYHGVYDLVLKHGFVPDLPYRAVIQSCHLGIIKPEKKIYHHAQELAGVPHENILFIDDYEVNIKSAGELGWQTVHFDTQKPLKSINIVREKLGL